MLAALAKIQVLIVGPAGVTPVAPELVADGDRICDDDRVDAGVAGLRVGDRQRRR